MDNKGEIVIYQAKSGETGLTVKLEDDTVWLTQKQMAHLFNKDVKTINRHVLNIFHDGELEKKATISKYEIVQNEGGREVSRSIEYYNLDMIISVGYRVNSIEGVRFRQWATRILREHMTGGYTLNKDRLHEVENLCRYLKDTVTVTTMNINRLRIDSARQKDLAILAEEVENVKNGLDELRKKLK